MIKYISVIIIMIFIISCSSSQLGWKSAPEAKKDKEKYIEDFDPLTLEEDFIILEDKTAKSEKSDEKGSKTNDIDKESPVETDQVSIQGFRVQLLATPNEEQARKAKQKAIYKIQENVYLEFESSLWKIRVGDCRTRKEAEELREKVRRIGRRENEVEWSNAWIVPSKIQVKRTIE
ncbi:MAG: SPOR domain-containing protein [bacterium]